MLEQKVVSLVEPVVLEAYIDATIGLSTSFSVEFSGSDGSFRLVSPSGVSTDVTQVPYVVADAESGLWRLVSCLAFNIVLL